MTGQAMRAGLFHVPAHSPAVVAPLGAMIAARSPLVWYPRAELQGYRLFRLSRSDLLMSTSDRSDSEDNSSIVG